MINAFCQHQRYRGFSPATIRRRRGTLRQFVRFIEPVRLADATPELVEQFVSIPRAARTRHAYRSDLRVFYRWAVERRHVAKNPTLAVESVKVPRSLPRPIDSADVLATLLHGHVQTRRMIGLALLAGLRCHEIAELQAEDVWLHSQPAVVVVRNGKGGVDRSVPIHPMLRNLLSGLSASGPIFRGQAGRVTVRPETVGRTIRRQFRAMGIVGTAHQLRHTFGTEIARVSGGDMMLTATLMGHASMNTTMGYVRLVQSAGADVIGLMYGDTAA